MEMNSSPTEERDFMMEAYTDPKFNSYDTGPGLDLPSNKQPGALAKSKALERGKFGIYLRHIPRELTNAGLLNLCAKSGTVQDYKVFDSGYTHKCGLIIFGTLNDAAQCMRHINESDTGIKAEFQKEKQQDDQASSSNNEPVNESIQPSDSELDLKR